MQTNTALAIVHHGPEDAGRVAALLRDRGIVCEYRSPLTGDDLPADLAGYSAVTIFGGTMGANDDHLEGIRRELDWIPRVVDSGVPLLGCCLGGQLIARALGARVYREPRGQWKAGYHPVYATPAGSRIFPDPEQHFYFWHQDGFHLPDGAVLLAGGDDMFPNQAFRFGESVYGVQFHPEAPSSLFTEWMKASPEFEDLPGAHSRRRQLDDAARFEAKVDTWLSDFLTVLLGQRSTQTYTAAG